MFGEKLFQTKLLSRLSHKVCRLLSSPVLLRKFINKRQRTVVWLIYHQSECQEEVIFVNCPCA